jgi:hypothetical protein
LVYAYFFLAHDALLQDDYINCITLCRIGLGLPATATPVQADFWEWLGISYASVGRPTVDVEACFANAISLEPLVMRIRRNADAYRQFLTDSRHVDYAVEFDVTPIQALRLSA